jgi:hypothetical protein
MPGAPRAARLAHQELLAERLHDVRGVRGREAQLHDRARHVRHVRRVERFHGRRVSARARAGDEQRVEGRFGRLAVSVSQPLAHVGAKSRVGDVNTGPGLPDG